MHEDSIFEDYILKNSIPMTNISLLKVAVTHRSALAIEDRDNYEKYNERLEFLGDSILNLVISEYVFKKFSDKPEGDLTKIKAYTVSKKSLMRVSKILHIEDILCVQGIARESTSFRILCANAVEAIIASVYLDSGIEHTQKFILEHFVPIIDTMIEGKHERDYKSLLQHHCQSMYQVKPIYKVERVYGPDHEKKYVVSVSILERKNTHITKDGKQTSQRSEEFCKQFGPCEGSSKQQAEQAVARIACDTMTSPLTGDILW